MIWAIISGILLIFFCWILFSPIFLYINTYEKKYSIGLKGILKLSLVPDEDQIFYIRISVIFFTFSFSPFKKKAKKPKTPSKAKKSKKKKKGPSFKTIWLFVKIGWNIVKSFRLKTLHFNIDTNDVINNAYLIPVFANLNRDNINLNVNYTGDFEVIINIENNIFRILVVSIHTYLRHKKYFNQKIIQ